MPITKSAKKALRQSHKRKARNLIYKNKIKSLVKKTRNFVIQGKIEEAKNFLPRIYKILDKAAKVGVIKKNTAARKKSGISGMINSKAKKES